MELEKETYPVDSKDVDGTKLHSVDQHPIKRQPWWKLGGTDYSFVSVDAGYARNPDSASSSNTRLDESEYLGKSVYDTIEAKEIYKPIEGYEGAHRFDPNFEWTPEEERKLVRTVSFNTPFITLSLANKRLARLAYCFTGLHNVFCPST